MKKKEMIAEIQKLADFHLGHKALSFDNYIRLSKDELKIRLSYARKMHIYDNEVKKIRDKYNSMQLHWLHLASDDIMTAEEIADRDTLNSSGRSASDLWLMVQL